MITVLLYNHTSYTISTISRTILLLLPSTHQHWYHTIERAQLSAGISYVCSRILKVPKKWLRPNKARDCERCSCAARALSIRPMISRAALPPRPVKHTRYQQNKFSPFYPRTGGVTSTYVAFPLVELDPHSNHSSRHLSHPPFMLYIMVTSPSNWRATSHAYAGASLATAVLVQLLFQLILVNTLRNVLIGGSCRL